MADIQSPQLLVVVTSFAKLEDAKVMARKLLEAGLSACVQMTEGIHSLYRWEGKICEETETILSAKTDVSRWEEISAFIKSHHPYELPELMGIAPAEYDQAYGQWVQAEVNSKS